MGAHLCYTIVNRIYTAPFETTSQPYTKPIHDDLGDSRS